MRLLCYLGLSLRCLKDYLYCLIYLARSSTFLSIVEESFVLSNMSKIMCNLFDSVAYLLVENIGVEPMTSCMPCKRSSQLS